VGAKVAISKQAEVRERVKAAALALDAEDRPANKGNVARMTGLREAICCTYLTGLRRRGEIPYQRVRDPFSKTSFTQRAADQKLRERLDDLAIYVKRLGRKPTVEEIWQRFPA
jgi:hypothetical protein